MESNVIRLGGVGGRQRRSTLRMLVDQGHHEGTLQVVGSSKETARAIVGGLEGAMLVARPYGDVTRFQAATTHLLAGLLARPIAHDGLTDGSRRPRSPQAQQVG